MYPGVVQFTPLILELSLIRSHLLCGEFSAFSAELIGTLCSVYIEDYWTIGNLICYQPRAPWMHSVHMYDFWTAMLLSKMMGIFFFEVQQNACHNAEIDGDGLYISTMCYSVWCWRYCCSLNCIGKSHVKMLHQWFHQIHGKNKTLNSCLII